MKTNIPSLALLSVCGVLLQTRTVAQNYFWNGKQKANIVANSLQAYVMHWEPLELDIHQLNRGTFILRMQCGDSDVNVDNRNFIKL